MVLPCVVLPSTDVAKWLMEHTFWMVDSLPVHLKPFSVAAIRSGIRYNPLAETESVSTASSAADALEALPGPGHIVPIFDLNADFTSLDK